MELLHFTGQVWRPPYEASSQLLQVTAGCTHNKCKFCSLYHGTKFRLSPITEVEEDLKVIQSYQPKARRVFLTGANPFVLSYNRLLDLGLLIRKYLRHCESIGMFARISDIKPKTVEELKNLRHLGFDGISIGTESGDDNTLAVMNKGYTANDIIEQCSIGIDYPMYVSQVFFIFDIGCSGSFGDTDPLLGKRVQACRNLNGLFFMSYLIEDGPRFAGNAGFAKFYF